MQPFGGRRYEKPYNATASVRINGGLGSCQKAACRSAINSIESTPNCLAAASFKVVSATSTACSFIATSYDRLRFADIRHTRDGLVAGTCDRARITPRGHCHALPFDPAFIHVLLSVHPALIRGRRLFEGGVYLRKYGMYRESVECNQVCSNV